MSGEGGIRIPRDTERKGVNAELGDDISRIFYEAIRQTWQNREGRFGRVDEQFGAFSGFRALDLDLLPPTVGLKMLMGTDGVGTKIEIAERMGNHRTPPIDGMAMSADDQARYGVEPVAAVVTLDAGSIHDLPKTREAIDALADGLIEAAALADVVVIGGETAELGNRVGGYTIEDTDLNYNLAISMIGVGHESRIITGHNVNPGDALVGIFEKGLRSNGITLVRDILTSRFGEQWHEEMFNKTTSLGSAVQTPSVVYTRLINKLTGGFDIRKPSLAEISGIAHITGGGIPEKLRRMLEPSGYGAILNNLMPPPEIMYYIQVLGGVPDEKAYKTWHMGPGMIVATPDPERVIKQAWLDGFPAQLIGEVIPDRLISIQSRGAEKPGQQLNYFI